MLLVEVFFKNHAPSSLHKSPNSIQNSILKVFEHQESSLKTSFKTRE